MNTYYIYYIDQKKGLPHIYNHNISESEVEDVLLRPGEDRHGRDGSRIVLGQTRAGRYLKVIYIPDAEQESVFIITAFELTGKPLVAYKRRRRKKE
ncbi:MAG: DUF4258 domain-containing protein [Desulfobacterales bacterium]|nr:DUF4258 domain-containing protein [Desulfobacterales bacterium]